MSTHAYTLAKDVASGTFHSGGGGLCLEYEKGDRTGVLLSTLTNKLLATNTKYETFSIFRNRAKLSS
jgi:hypothetical protein